MQVDELQALQDKIASLEKRLKAAETQCQATTREIWQMEVDLERMQERAKEAEERVEQLQQQVAAGGEQSAPTAELEAARIRAQEAEEHVEQLQQQLAAGGEQSTAAAELEAAQGRAKQAEERVEQLQQQLAAGSEQSAAMAELQAQLAAAEEQLQCGAQANEARVRELERELTAAREELERPNPELATLRDQLDILRIKETRLQDELGFMRNQGAEQASLREQVERLQAELAEEAALRERMRGREAEQASLREELSNLRSRESELLSEIAALRAQNERDRVKLELLQEAEADLRRQVSVLESSAKDQDASVFQQKLVQAEERASLANEKALLMQERLERAQERMGLAEEKATLLQQRFDQVDVRARDAEARARQAELDMQSFKDRVERAETRVRDADKIFEAAEQAKRETEDKNRDSWQRVRDAEMRANQATVEAKKLADKLSEYEKKQADSDRETQRLAFQDPLTGLPNINLISQYLDFTVKQSLRYKRVAAVLVVDIDRFKVFNEAMGMKAGDELLVQIAERLKTAVRETDSLGRKGEDEFLILLSEINIGEDHRSVGDRRRTIQQHVQVVAHRVQQSLAAPITVQGQKFYIQASIGISICPDDGDSPQALFENADTAMYHAKESGRNCFEFYSGDLRKRQEKRLSLDNQLRYALERGEFQVLYHPVMSLAKGKAAIIGAEALIRWQHRIDGLVGPEYFLSGAEESGMIVPIGNWVIKETCRQLREWLSSGIKIFASVNLSKRQLLQADLVESISQALRENGVPPDMFYVEIAEGFNTFNPDLMDSIVTNLGLTGVKIAIDDFGIGYSSLSRLNLNHTRIIKIDRSIIQSCPGDKQSVTIAIAAINLASSLGVLSLAEGVENAAQIKFLTKYGCDLAQGHYFEQALTPSELAGLLRSKKTWKI